jgi:hypothetical protein
MGRRYRFKTLKLAGGTQLITNQDCTHTHRCGVGNTGGADVMRSPEASYTPSPRQQLRATKRTCGPARLRNRVANTEML